MLRHRTTITYIILFFLVDQITKYLFVDQGLLSTIFVPVFNTGAARSLPIPEIIITIVAIVISIRMIRLYTQKQISTTIVILFIAGIRGNMIDRVFYPGVRDFISLGNRFPIFNIADIYLTVGVILIIRSEYKHHTTKTTHN